jgi:hypothetical protein
MFMADRGTSTEVATPTNGPIPVAALLPETLEDRVRRLEDAMAVLQDTRRLEERVAERVAGRLNRGSLTTEAANISASASRALMPVARYATRVADTATQSANGIGLRQSWLLLDFFQEVRAIIRMYFDRRYRFTILARVVPITGLVLILLSWLMISGITFIGPILDRCFEIVLVCIVYKVLTREAQRYRHVTADMPPLKGFYG